MRREYDRATNMDAVGNLRGCSVRKVECPHFLNSRHQDWMLSQSLMSSLNLVMSFSLKLQL